MKKLRNRAEQKGNIMLSTRGNKSRWFNVEQFPSFYLNN